MNDFSVLKKLAQDANEQFPALEDQWSMVCTPTVGLELLAEIERLRTAEGDAMTYKAGMENVAQQRDQLKADTKENEMHMRAFGEVMKSQAAQIEQLKAENEALQKLSVELRGAAKCYNLHHCKAEQHAISEPCKVLARIDAAISK
jgi:hypothetical protein